MFPNILFKLWNCKTFLLYRGSNEMSLKDGHLSKLRHNSFSNQNFAHLFIAKQPLTYKE